MRYSPTHGDISTGMRGSRRGAGVPLALSATGGELMRSVLVACAVTCVLALAPRVHASTLASGVTPTVSAAAPTFALQVPDKKIEVTVGDRPSGRVWYQSPVWIAIGALALIVLVMLVVLLARSGGGGTTIVRD